MIGQARERGPQHAPLLPVLGWEAGDRDYDNCMAHTFTDVLIHFVFSSHDRQPFIHADIRDDLYAYLGGIVRGLDGTALAVGIPLCGCMNTGWNEGVSAGSAVKGLFQ